jgi:hypothetical protein
MIIGEFYQRAEQTNRDVPICERKWKWYPSSFSCCTTFNSVHSIGTKLLKFPDDAIFLLLSDIIQSSVSPDALMNFIDIFDSLNPPFSPETVDDLMFLRDSWLNFS